VPSSPGGHHIAYAVDLWHGGIVTALYVVATCGALLVSDHRYVGRFGAINLLAVVVLAWFDQGAVVSLWCTWAAVVSIAIALHLRVRRRRHRRSRVRDPVPEGGER